MSGFFRHNCVVLDRHEIVRVMTCVGLQQVHLTLYVMEPVGMADMVSGQIRHLELFLTFLSTSA